MLAFKETIRHLWNTSFILSGERASFEAMECYQDQLVDHLFRTLVTERIGIPYRRGQYGNAPTMEIIVLPRPGLAELPVMKNHDAETRGQWSNEISVTTNSLGDCHFIEFFSWDSFEFIDLQYIRCHQPEAKCEYLIEQDHCRFGMHI